MIGSVLHLYIAIQYNTLHYIKRGHLEIDILVRAENMSSGIHHNGSLEMNTLGKDLLLEQPYLFVMM